MNKFHTIFRKALLLAATMVAAQFFGNIAFGQTPPSPTGGTLDVDDTVNVPVGITYSGGVFTFDGANGLVYEIIGTTTDNRIVVPAGVTTTVILNDVSIIHPDYSPFEIVSGAEVTMWLEDDSENRLECTYAPSLSTLGNRSGINVSAGATLTIKGNTGALEAIGGKNGTGIGNSTCGNIFIYGGNITATYNHAADYSVGIGGDVGSIVISGTANVTVNNVAGTAIGGNSSSVLISGHAIVVAMGSSGAGIGSSARGSSGTITITDDAFVTAESEWGGAAIGGGGNGSGTGVDGGEITISGRAIVVATVVNNGTSTHSGIGGAAIGGGGCSSSGLSGGSGGTIKILDYANVTATSDRLGAAIGGGHYADGGIITISGHAVVTAKSGSGTTGYGACIGGGGAGGTFSGSYPGGGGGIITISEHAVVTATGVATSSTCTGIGGGAGTPGGAGGIITISDNATVTATGSGNGAGIGGGYPGSSGGTITISDNAVVTATGGGGTGAGIGGAGNSGSGGTITISDYATVTATGSNNIAGGAGIGGGSGSTPDDPADITIGENTIVKAYSRGSVKRAIDASNDPNNGNGYFVNAHFYDYGTSSTIGYISNSNICPITVYNEYTGLPLKDIESNNITLTLPRTYNNFAFTTNTTTLVTTNIFVKPNNSATEQILVRTGDDPSSNISTHSTFDIASTLNTPATQVWLRGVVNKVIFMMNDGSGDVYDRRFVSAGQTLGVNMPVNPTRENYVFKGWATTDNATVPDFLATTPISGDITVYAIWELTPENGGAICEGDKYVISGEVSGEPDGDIIHAEVVTGYGNNSNLEVDITGKTFVITYTPGPGETLVRIYMYSEKGGCPIDEKVVEFRVYPPLSAPTSHFDCEGDHATVTVLSPLNGGGEKYLYALIEEDDDLSGIAWQSEIEFEDIPEGTYILLVKHDNDEDPDYDYCTAGETIVIDCQCAKPPTIKLKYRGKQ